MKKFFTALSAVMLLGTALSANAQTQVTADASAITLQANTLYYYEATADGTVTMTTTQDASYFDSSTEFVYSNESHTTKVPLTSSNAGNTGSNYTCSFDVTTGEKYYFFFDYPSTVTGFVLTMESSQDPDPGPTPSDNTITWGQTTTLQPGNSYVIDVPGGQAYFVTDLTVQNLANNGLLKVWWKDPSYMDQYLFTQTSTLGTYTFNSSLPQASYTVEVGSGVAKSFQITFYSGVPVTPPTEIFAGGVAKDLNANTVYCYQALDNGTLTLSTTTDASFIESGFIYSDETHSSKVTLASNNGGTSGSNYTCTLDVTKGEKYYIWFDYPNQLTGVTLTLSNDTTEPEQPEQPGEPETPEASVITPKELFTIDENSLVWVYTPTEAVPNFYFEIGPYPYNVFEEISYMDYLAFSKNQDGSEPIELNYIELSDSGIYTGTNLEAGTPYYLVPLNYQPPMYPYYQATLYLEEYESEVITPMELGKEYPFSQTNNKYQYSNTQEGDYYLMSNSTTNLLEGGLTIVGGGNQIFSTSLDVEAVEGEDGLVYNGLYLQPGEVYTFEYSGTDEILLTLMSGTYTAAGGTVYMENYATPYEAEITLNDTNSSVEISWGVEVEIADADNISIPVTLVDGDIVGKLTATQVQLLAAGADVAAGGESKAVTGDKGTTLVILTGGSGLFTQAGRYTLNIPAGIVANADGAVNKAQEVVVEVVALAEGTVTPESGAIFTEGEEVSFTVTYESDIVKNDDLDPVASLNSADGVTELDLDWETAASYITIEDDTLTVNCGDELAAGTYTFTIYEGAFTVDGVNNAKLVINFTVESDTDAINSIGAAIEDDAVIYNLQGVKVNKNQLTKGIYIINGKKVAVK